MRSFTEYVDGHTLDPSERDLRMMFQAQAMARGHESGGTYDMAAMWVKGSRRAVGTNKLTDPAILKSQIYDYRCGMHAELAMWYYNRERIFGGTVYVAGKLNSSGSEMTNTAPCIYCASIIDLAGVRFVVYCKDGEVVKSRPKELY